MANKITVQLSAKEFYTGEAEVILPEGITEEMISGVEPDGYGEFCIFLQKKVWTSSISTWKRMISHGQSGGLGASSSP